MIVEYHHSAGQARPEDESRAKGKTTIILCPFLDPSSSPRHPNKSHFQYQIRIQIQCDFQTSFEILLHVHVPVHSVMPLSFPDSFKLF